jgi:ubiquinone/menaquinone biosynthesis C-methylase UbiE
MTEATPRSDETGQHDSSRSLSEWNEEMVQRYDIERYYERSHPLILWLEKRRLKAVLELADARNGERVLEVGCGAGHVLEMFPLTRRTGLDLSPTMLANTRRRLGTGVALVQALADKLPIRTGAFRVIICTEVLEHTPDPQSVLKELMRAAGPEGRVVVSIPREENIDRAKSLLRRIPLLRSLLATLADEGNEWHLHHMNLPMLREMVRGVARIERIRKLPFPILPVRYVALLRKLD